MSLLTAHEPRRCQVQTVAQEVWHWGREGEYGHGLEHRRVLRLHPQLFRLTLENKAGAGAVRVGPGLGSQFYSHKLHNFGDIPFPLRALVSPYVKGVSDALLTHTGVP